MAHDLENTRLKLELFRDFVISESRKNLANQDKNVSNNLSNKISGDFKSSPNSFELSFYMPLYGQVQDKGIKGKFSSFKAPDSPFKFGTGTGEKGGLTKGINQWVKARRFQFRDKKGRLMSYDSTAFLITRSVYSTGIRPSLFFTTPFNQSFQKYIDKEMIEAFNLDIDDLMKYTLQNEKI